MRVHHITSDYSFHRGGAQYVIRSLHAGLLALGVSSHIFGLMSYGEEELVGARSLGLRSPYGWRGPVAIDRYFRDVVQPGDIVHAHLFPTLLYVSLLRLLRRVSGPVIATEHSTSNRRRGTRVGKWIDALTYSGFDKVIAISHGAREALVLWKPSLAEKTVVIYNGAAPRYQSFRRRPAGGPFAILSVGRLHPIKNYAAAIRAVSQLKDLDFVYRIAGEGKELSGLQELTRSLGLEGRVEFLGHVADLSSVLETADVFLIPSLWEGFGLAALEAMNAGLPLVASDVSGLRELVSTESPCAILVDPASTDQIAEALLTLSREPLLVAQMGREGFKRSMEFTCEAMVQQYIEVYAECMSA